MKHFDRRSISAFAAGAGSLVVWPHCLAAAGKELSPLSFVVVSDTHLGYRDQDHAEKQWAGAMRLRYKPVGDEAAAETTCHATQTT